MSKIRELRNGFGLSIAKLSQQAGVNASTLSWAELGKVTVSPAVRAALARFYEQPEESLFNSAGFAR